MSRNPVLRAGIGGQVPPKAPPLPPHLQPHRRDTFPQAPDGGDLIAPTASNAGLWIIVFLLALGGFLAALPVLALWFTSSGVCR